MDQRKELAGQKRLEFADATRRSLIEVLPLSRRVRDFLLAIDVLTRTEEFGMLEGPNAFCDASLETIGQEMRASRRTVCRAIADVVSAARPFCTVDRQTGMRHLIALHWSAIEAAASQNRDAGMGGTDSDTHATTHANPCHKRLAPVPCHPCQSGMGHPCHLAPVPASSMEWGSPSPTPVVRARAPLDLIDRKIERSFKRDSGTDPEKAEAKTLDAWLDVEPEAIGNAAAVWRSFERAKEGGIVQECEADRLGFLAAAIQAKRKGKYPLALFAALVQRRAWDPGKRGIAESAFDEARKLVRAQRGSPAVSTAHSLQPTASRARDHPDLAPATDAGPVSLGKILQAK